MLSLNGTIVTADALNCQREIARQIVDQGGDYALALKSLLSVDADHGRIETRTATVSTDIGWLRDAHHWFGLAAIGKLVRSRETAGKTTTETAYYLLSTALTGERLKQVARSHWGIENRPHWRLDVVMSEDQDGSRLDNGPHNLAILRHMALNVMLKDPTNGSCEANSSEPVGMTPISLA